MKSFSEQCNSRAEVSQGKAVIITTILTILMFIVLSLLNKYILALPVLLFTFAFFIGSMCTWFIAGHFAKKTDNTEES